MRRGEIWQYDPVVPRPGQSTLRLVVSADAVNAREEIPVVLTLKVIEADPANLLAVQLGRHGWAWMLGLEPSIRRRLRSRVDVVDKTTMEAVSAALRAVQDL